MFIYETSVEKKEQRLHVAKHLSAMIKKTNRIIKVCTAPADNFEFEEHILKTYGNDIIVFAFEKDAETYEKGLKRFKYLKAIFPNLIYQNEDMLDYDMSFFDFIFMDIFGIICDTNITNFIDSIDSIKRKGTEIFATFQNTRTYVAEKKKYGLEFPSDVNVDEKANIWSDWKTITLPRYIEQQTGLTTLGLPYKYANKSINPMATQMIMYHFKKMFDN